MEVVVKPVTRIEGNAEIVIDQGKVKFKVLEFRGFEKIVVGRSFEYLPVITSRICGICPVAHAVASCKAVEEAMNIEVPERAKNLRKLLLLAQILQSHSLHLFYLALPDYYSKKSVIELVREKKKMVNLATSLRELANKVVEAIAVRSLHPEVVPGGVVRDLTESKIENLKRDLLEKLRSTIETKDELKDVLLKSADTILKTHYAALASNTVEFYDGKVRVIDEEGKEVASFLSDYEKYLEERVESFSYSKFPYFRGKVFRVGPLARLNVCKFDTEVAEEEQKEVFRTVRHEILLSNYARFVEIIYCIEKAVEILENVKPGKVRVKVTEKSGEGVGIVEAPRGTLIHHYLLEDGFLRKANLIVPTTINNTAINAELNAAYEKIGENREMFEAIVRAYDPCLSCATH